MDDNKYLFPYDNVKNYFISRIKGDLYRYIDESFKNGVEIDVQKYYKETYAHDSFKEMCDMFIENEQTDFDQRVEEEIEKNKNEFDLVFNAIKQWDISMMIPSITYYFDEDPVYFRTQVTEKDYAKMILNFLDIKKNDELDNKKAKLVIAYDASGSVGIWERTWFRTFYFLIHTVFNSVYQDVDSEFVEYSSDGTIVKKKDFFKIAAKGGGSIVSSGLKVVDSILDSADKDTDCYVILFSDGDNLSSDNVKCEDIIKNNLVNKSKYVYYFETNQYNRVSSLLSHFRHFKHDQFSYDAVQDFRYPLEKIVRYFENSTFKDKIKVSIKS